MAHGAAQSLIRQYCTSTLAEAPDLTHHRHSHLPTIDAFLRATRDGSNLSRPPAYITVGRRRRSTRPRRLVPLSRGSRVHTSHAAREPHGPARRHLAAGIKRHTSRHGAELLL